LRVLQESHESIVEAMGQLQGQCIYCIVMIEEADKGQSHEYSDCIEARANGCGFEAYKQWREEVDFGQAKHCWECGLSQRICRRLERLVGQRMPCEYADIMLPSIFILH
jgi:hypothetical protein